MTLAIHLCRGNNRSQWYAAGGYDAIAEIVPLERLALSPQCGFASMAEGNLLTQDEQWAKLALVVETARRIWS